MKRTIVFLPVVMIRGFGVAIVVEELSRRLMTRGIDVRIGCERTDGTFSGLKVDPIICTAQGVRDYVRDLDSPILVPQASPFFELVPELSKDYECWVWENGDPTPSLFIHDRIERKSIVQNKFDNVLPCAKKIIAISDFIKHDINVRDAKIILLGCDHCPTISAKEQSHYSPNQPLKVGALMRIGPGEALYKGNNLFTDLISQVKRLGIPVEAHAAGRGNERDASVFSEQGIVTHLNLSDPQKFEYLRGLDIFISFSLWEGFNLPLVEAQAMGTLSFALDTGAHPEVCPFILNTPSDAIRYIHRATQDRHWLCKKSAECFNFVRSNLSWDKATDCFEKLLNEA